MVVITERSATEQKETHSTEIEQDFKDLDRGWVAAFLQGDTELFDRIWTDGFVFTAPFGQFTNKQQELADIKSGDIAFESLSTGELTVHVYGTTAVMAGRFMVRGNYKGRDISGAYTYTNLLEKQLEQPWQIVSSHSTPVG